MRVIPAILLALAGLAGCAAKDTYCMKEQPYLKAQTLPPLQAPPGLTIQQAPAALVIPPPPERYIPYGRMLPDPKAKDGQRIDCLDKPPILPPPITGAPINETPLSGSSPSESPSKPAAAPAAASSTAQPP